MNYDNLIKSGLAIVQAVTANPYAAIAGLIVLLGVAIFFFFKGKSLLQALAARKTEQGKQDFVDYQVPKNEENTKKDNEGRDNLNGAK